MRPVADSTTKSLNLKSNITKCQVVEPHGPYRGEEDEACKGWEDEPAGVRPEEDDAAAPAGQVHLLCRSVSWLYSWLVFLSNYLPANSSPRQTVARR